ncbi:MAG: DsbA family protein [Mesorhizobium sp.]|nr:DsbA family protein [Mesorhizobium sp.]
MIRSMRRRDVVLSLAAVSATVLLASCGEDAPKTPEAADTPAKPATALPTPVGTVDMAKLLEPGALPEKSIGNADAPVTIVEYASMTCPHCATFHARTLPEIKTKYIDTGKARMIFREFPFDPRAEAGFMLARCSDDKYFAMVDVLFKQQGGWAAVADAKAALMQISKLAGFSQESFEACLTDQKLLDDIRAVRTRGANDFGVDSTPTFFINGNRYAGALTVDEMSALIDSMV